MPNPQATETHLPDDPPRHAELLVYGERPYRSPDGKQQGMIG